MQAGDWLEQWRVAEPRMLAGVEEKVKARIANLVTEVEGRAPARWGMCEPGPNLQDVPLAAHAPAADATAAASSKLSEASACSITSTGPCTP